MVRFEMGLVSGLPSYKLVLMVMVTTMWVEGVQLLTMGNIARLLEERTSTETHVNLSNRGLSGPIPAALGFFTNITYLDLSMNKFEGPIPSELCNLSNLVFLNLSINYLSGVIPVEIGNLTRLASLDLRANKLVGEIPSTMANLSELAYLDLSINRLTGSLPHELGEMRRTEELHLSNNTLYGHTSPPMLANLANLRILDLSNNRLSGPIPSELGNLANLRILDLSSNDLSDAVPPELGNLANLTSLALSNNDLSDPIPAALGNLANLRLLDLSRNDFSGPIPPEFGNLSHLVVLIINSPLPTSLSALGELRALSIFPARGGAPVLDLSSIPSDCHYVRWMGGELTGIVLWSACTKGTGCVVDLIGSSSRLSRQTRRQVCLNKASVLLSGSSPQLGLDIYKGQHGKSVTSVYMSNLYGTYFFNSTSFLDDIYLGPRGEAYTGVGFTRVQAGNLCGNPEAKRVIAVAYGTFVVSLFLTTLVVVVVGRWRRRIRGSGFNVQRKRPGRVQVLALYAWRVLMAVVPIVDIVTDSLVLNAVWGAWPMWIALLSIAAPFVAAAIAVAHFWASMGWRIVRGCWDVNVKWIWRPYLRNMALIAPDAPNSWSTRLAAIMVAPVALLGVIIQDLLTVLDNLGLRLMINGQLVSFEGYHNGRILMELLLESVPQAAFQTALYALGSSRATRIYIDQQIFVQSISFALLNMFLQYSDMLWESVYEGRSFHAIVSGRLRSSRPVFIEQLEEEESEANEKIVGSDDLGL